MALFTEQAVRANIRVRDGKRVFYLGSHDQLTPSARQWLNHERVEIIPDDRPPTNKQEQLIAKLVKDFPDAKELMEYED